MVTNTNTNTMVTNTKNYIKSYLKCVSKLRLISYNLQWQRLPTSSWSDDYRKVSFWEHPKETPRNQDLSLS